MTYRASIVVGTLLALLACSPDPYEKAKGGTPALLGGQITAFDANAASFPESYYATALTETSPGVWSVTSTKQELPNPDTADGTPPVITDQTVLQLFFNKLLDGKTVQTAPDSCVPAGNWVQVAPATGCPWYSCYFPSSPSPEQGGSIYLFQTCGTVGASDNPFLVAEPLPTGTYRITNVPNTVKDQEGNALTFDITLIMP